MTLMVGERLELLEPGMIVAYDGDPKLLRRVLPDVMLQLLLDDPMGAKAGTIINPSYPERYVFVRWEDSDDPNGR